MSKINVNDITNLAGTGAPNFENGVSLAGTTIAAVASQAEAEAGTVNTRLMTPLRTKQAIDSLVPNLGVGQTWQDVSASRNLGTSYQNTTGKPIVVSVGVYGPTSAGGQPFFQVSSNNSTWINVAWHSDAAVQQATIVIPNNWYYRTANVTNKSNSGGWSELR